MSAFPTVQKIYLPLRWSHKYQKQPHQLLASCQKHACYSLRALGKSIFEKSMVLINSPSTRHHAAGSLLFHSPYHCSNFAHHLYREHRGQGQLQRSSSGGGRALVSCSRTTHQEGSCLICRGLNQVSGFKEQPLKIFSPQKRKKRSVIDKKSRNVHEYEGSNLKLIMPHGIKLTSVWLHLHLSVYSSSHLRFI